MNWLPIETAPKHTVKEDGQWKFGPTIYLKTARGEWTVGHWVIFDSNLSYWRSMADDLSPTHWMPIPSPDGLEVEYFVQEEDEPGEWVNWSYHSTFEEAVDYMNAMAPTEGSLRVIRTYVETLAGVVR
jgi:hypothetical protein